MIGNRKMMEDSKIAITESIDAKLAVFEKEGKTAILVAIDNTLSGIIALSDTIKKMQKMQLKLCNIKE
jgi:P-type Cu+ transporter